MKEGTMTRCTKSIKSSTGRISTMIQTDESPARMRGASTNIQLTALTYEGKESSEDDYVQSDRCVHFHRLCFFRLRCNRHLCAIRWAGRYLWTHSAERSW